VIVDPGPESAHRALLDGLDGFVPRAILLTHIHFDHAGATGALCRLWPEAEVWVHERGAKHMADPSRLVASAKRIYGDEFDRLWGEVNPVPEERMKILTGGRWLWTRTIGSTLFGEGVDSLIFYPLAFYGTGIIPDDKLPTVMLAQFVTKVAVEVVFTPVTYAIVGWLKRAENEDYYDRNTRFTPFTLKV